MDKRTRTLWSSRKIPSVPQVRWYFARKGGTGRNYRTYNFKTLKHLTLKFLRYLFGWSCEQPNKGLFDEGKAGPEVVAKVTILQRVSSKGKR